MNFLTILFIYFLSFTDKNGSDHIALGERALEQRAKWEIGIDSLDYAVSSVYLDSVRALGATVMHTSRWMNGTTVSIPEDSITLARLRECSFIKDIELTRDESHLNIASMTRDTDIEVPVGSDTAIYGRALQQLELYNLPPLHKAGFEGQGIHMAVIDGGFQSADSVTAFNSIREQILGHYDLTDDKYDFFGDKGFHGTACLSLIAAVRNDFLGSATKACYYMIRSEECDTESPKEGDNLVAALELADSLGVNIASVSLGYYAFDNPSLNYSYQDMDGKSTRPSRAATIAARKGMLLCVSAGNEGKKEWHYITTPADADSILTVGAVYKNRGVTDFSSRGPAYDGRIKPEVCAFGSQATILNASTDSLRTGSGTSYACPLTAGLAACLWSAHPDETAQQIRWRIMRSADRYDAPDNDYGYGIPDAWKAHTLSITKAGTAVQDSYSIGKSLIDGRILILKGDDYYDISGRKSAR